MGIVDKAGNVTLPAKVPWYDYQIHPARQFLFWAARHLHKLPPEWRPYYRRLLKSELYASRYYNVPWDVFMCVVEGYRKGKWVVRKYGAEPDEASIPHPYNNFWDVTTPEERAWAYRRSFQLKDLQALQRERCDVYGATRHDTQAVGADQVQKLVGRSQNGNEVHAMDLPSPVESDMREVREDRDMTDQLMASIEDDKRWNPCYKAREYQARMDKEHELMQFEDEDDDLD